MNLLQRIIGSESPKLEKPLKAFAGYLLQGSGLSDRIHLKRSQYTVPFFAKSNVALTLFVNPDFIDRAEEFVYDFLKSGDTLIDVGANIGCVTAAGSLAVGDSGRVFSIEPHPQTFLHLQQTVQINHCTNVICLNVALGEDTGVVRFTDEKRKDDNNRVSLDSSAGMQVPCVTLASLIDEHRLARVAMLKIDVEGFEMHVLRGAESVLNRVDCLYVEVLEHTLQKFGSSGAELIGLLRSHGFSCYHFKDDRSNVVAFAGHVSSGKWQKELVAVGQE